MLAKGDLKIVVRGDDAGSCLSANTAIIEAADCGLLKNVSIMVPGPAFAEAAALLAGRKNLCLGLHVTLNAEWERVKWSPVLPALRVPSLVDENGCFTQSPQVLHERGLDVEQAIAEVTAQLARARAHGLEIAYLDEHMGVSWVGGLRAMLADFAAREGLFDVHLIPGLPNAATGETDLSAQWAARVVQAPAGTFMMVAHPGRDDDDMRRFSLPDTAPGIIARERNAERLALCSPQLAAAFRERGAHSIFYTDCAEG